MLATRIQRITPSATLAVSEQARRLRAAGHDVLDLSAGQPDFPTPEPIKEAGKRAIDENRTTYTATEGVEDLRAAIASGIERDRGRACTPEQVLVSPGAKTSLYLACQALFDPGDEVLLPAPYWTTYPEQIRLAGAEPVLVPCSEAGGFKLSAAELDAACTPRTRGVILNYPSNPTGACYDREELAALARVAVSRELWIVADEIYSGLVYDDRPFSSVAALGPEVERSTVVIDGMSKTYSMTGWRLGYATGPVPVIGAMAKLQGHMTSNATSISQWAGLAALELAPSILAARRREFQARRDTLLEGLRAIPGLRCIRPEGAFYAFPNVGGCFGGDIRSGRDLAAYLLERARVAVIPGEAFGSPEHLRLSFACSAEMLSEATRRIGSALEALTTR